MTALWGLAAAGAAAAAAAAPAAVNSGQEAPDAPVLTLSAALTQAALEGPGFAAAELQQKSRALADEAGAAGRKPVVAVSSRTDVRPALGHRLTATLAWELTEELSLEASVSASSGDGERLSGRLHWSFWPPKDADFIDAGRELDRRVARRRADEAAFQAMRDLIGAFYALRDARFAVAVAEQAVAVAAQRAAIAAERFAAGQIGLSEWQAAQRAERQAHVELRVAHTDRRQATERLARLLFAAGEAGTGEPPPFGPLVDDLPWSTVTESVETVLAGGQDIVLELFLAHDAAYLEAVRSRHQQEELLAEAERATRINWRASVEYSAPLTRASASPAGGGAGAADGGDPGRGAGVAAWVTAALDLGSPGRIRHEQARVSLELAQLRTEQARHAALDAAAAALQAAEDAAFIRQLAAEALEEAQAAAALVERRMELGFAAPLEMDEARLELLRSEKDLARAEGELRLAWLELAHRLGVPVEWPARLDGGVAR